MQDALLALELLLVAAAVLCFLVAISRRYRRRKTKGRARAEPGRKRSEAGTFRVVRIIDGDTVEVRKFFRKVRIRLDSIDCPEDGQPWGETARAGLIKLIGGRSVRLEEYGRDPYGRTLATLYVRSKEGSDWLNVNERMVVLGHAWVMRRFYSHLPRERQIALNRIEAWAKSRKVGLWKTSNPIPPWKWRADR
jgi:endonuclease YncB( thermonuclease family)